MAGTNAVVALPAIGLDGVATRPGPDGRLRGAAARRSIPNSRARSRGPSNTCRARYSRADPEAAQARRRGRPNGRKVRRGGAFDQTEPSVPGPAGAPDLRLLRCRAAAASGPYALI
jgi:hypothetical protein